MFSQDRGDITNVTSWNIAKSGRSIAWLYAEPEAQQMDQLELRVEAALTRLLEPHFVLSERRLQCLLRFLTEKEEDLGATGYPRVREEFLVPWLKRCVDRLDASPSLELLAFASGLVASVCSDEATFVKLNFTNIVAGVVELVRSAPDPSIRPVYVELMASLLAHRSGTQFVCVRNLWFDVYSMIGARGAGVDAETSTRCCRFMVALLERTKLDDEAFCCGVIEAMIAPLADLAVVHSLPDASIEHDSLRMSIVVLKGILEVLYEKNCNEMDFKVITMFKERHRLEQTVDSLIAVVREPDLRFELYKFSFLLAYFEVARALFNGLNISPDYGERIVKHLLDAIELYGTERSLECFTVKLRYFQKISCSSETSGSMNYGFLSQMLLFVVRPLHYYAFEVLELHKYNQNDDDDCRRLFTLKVLGDMVPITFKMVCKLTSSSKKFTIYDATSCLLYLESLSAHFVRAFANNVAQMLIYLLVDIVAYLRQRPEGAALLTTEFLVAFLRTLKTLLQRFDLSWRDGPEVVYVGGVVVDLLRFDWWSAEIVVEALSLLRLSISRCLSPRMALLIDSDWEEARSFERIVLRKMADEEGAVRVAAVEVVAALSSKALNKFESYAGMALEVDLPERMLSAATRDPVAEVRVSAFECLGEMVRHEEFRRRLLDAPRLVDDTLAAIRSHGDARVRAAAVSFVDALHVRSPHLLAGLRGCLCAAIRDDADLDVRKRALRFWRTVAQKMLEERGAVDGVFPEATFSRRTRRIVTFDEAEIRRCLDDVLDELSLAGGLGAFLYALRSEERELRIEAIAAVADLVALLNRYFLATPGDVATPVAMDVVAPHLDDFCEDVLNMEDFLLGNETRSSTESSTTTTCDARLLERNEFLRFACNYDFHRDMETGRLKGTTGPTDEEDIYAVLREILAS